jgi:predicted CopG family antitoxin
MEELVFLIIKELYGEDPAKVSRVLFIKNKCTFKSLLQFTQLEDQVLRNSLIVLVQQLIVSYEENLKIVYHLNEDEVLARIRYPKYIRLMNLKYGDDCCVEDILENGCCSISQLVESAKESHKNPDSVTRILNEMISRDYILLVDKKSEHKDSFEVFTTKKNKGRPKKKMKMTLPNQSIISEAIPSSTVSSNDAYYRLNFSKLNKEVMSDIIGTLISSKTNLNCAIIGETMYKIGFRSLNKTDISNELPSVPRISIQILESCLDILEKADLVLRDTENTWKINLPLIANILSTATLEKVIQGRFGDYASRVFRILCNKGLLDDKTVSDLTLLPLKETNICINELFAAGFVYSKAIGTSQMHYGVKVEEVKDDILKQSYKAIYNLKLKLASEMESVWGLVQRVGFLSSDEKQMLERYKHIESRIESAILELDRTIMIFKLD